MGRQTLEMLGIMIGETVSSMRSLKHDQRRQDKHSLTDIYEEFRLQVVYQMQAHVRAEMIMVRDMQQATETDKGIWQLVQVQYMVKQMQVHLVLEDNNDG